MGKLFDSFKHGDNSNPKFMISFQLLEISSVILYYTGTGNPPEQLNKIPPRKLKTWKAKVDMIYNMISKEFYIEKTYQKSVKIIPKKQSRTMLELFVMTSDKSFSNGLGMIGMKNTDN